jgi:uncharacterized delta-60 repeat protein
MSTRQTVLATLLGLAFAAPAAEGDLDPSYGVGGVVRVPLNTVAAGNDQAFALAVLPDARVVLAGYTEVPLPGGMGTQLEQVVVRARADGNNFDLSFGVNGVRRVSFGNTERQNIARFMQRLPDGRLLVAGEVDGNPGPVFEPDFSIFRLTPDGSLDPSFDLDGRRQIAFQGQDGIQDLDVYPDGRILISGFTAPSGSVDACGLMFRLNSDGSDDTSFGTGGSVCFQPATGTPPLTFVTGPLILDDGRIIATGIVNSGSGDPFANVDMFAAGRLADGSPDLSFGSSGVRIFAFDQGGSNFDASLASALQPDGRIVMAGRETGPTSEEPEVERPLQNGNLDPSFGTGGRVVISLDLSPGGNDGVRSIALQDNGRIVLAGSAQREPGGSKAAIIVRLLPNGALDPSFGSGGIVAVSPSILGTSQDDAFFAAVTIANGQIHAAGGVRGSSTSGDFDMLLVRLLGSDLFADGFETL